MGSGYWFKNIISSKKAKNDRSKQLTGSSASEKLNGVNHKNHSQKKPSKIMNGTANGNFGIPGMPIEDVAATRIQTAYRAYVARKSLRRLKGILRLQVLTQNLSGGKQASTTLSYLHLWSRIQSQITARRLSMVTENRIRQKKLENQLKLEAKLHDVEVEWCGGSGTMGEILARIHQREEAAVKRERALAYAFSHQWRANSNSILGPPEVGKANWGWSWMERWIAVRPWERRVFQMSPKKLQNRSVASNSGKYIISPNTKTPVSVKIISPNSRGSLKARKLSFVGAENPAPQGSIKTEETETENGQVAS